MRKLFEDFLNDPDFYEEFLDFYDGPEESAKQYYLHYFQEFLNRISSIKTSNQGIVVWRVINAESLNNINLDAIGASWSYNKSAAHSWYGGDGEPFIIEAIIPFSEVNKEVTLRQNLVNPDEQEIRVEGNCTIYLLSISKKDGTILKEFNPQRKCSSGKIGIFGDWNE